MGIVTWNPALYTNKSENPIASSYPMRGASPKGEKGRLQSVRSSAQVHPVNDRRKDGQKALQTGDPGLVLRYRQEPYRET